MATSEMMKIMILKMMMTKKDEWVSDDHDVNDHEKITFRQR